jgi:peptidoglycan lytic transglycosylase D
MFGGQLDDLAAELESVNERLAALGDANKDPGFGRTPAMSRTGSVTPGFWERLRMPALAFEPNARVEKYVRYFTESAEGRKTFVSWLKRSGKYREVVLESMRKNDVPQDLIAVAFIESGFRPKAVSSAGATGLWQFMPRTARAYGLKVGRRYDERRSIWRSTDAASRHLADLHEYFQSWELALAAYNYGYERLAALSERMATKNFWSLSAVKGALPRETVLYVPKVLAVAVVLNNLDRFELDDVSIDAPIAGAPLEVAGGIRLSLIARAAGTSLETIRAMNPEFKKDETPRGDRPVWVHIPSDGLARARVLLPRLLEDADQNTDDTRVPDGFNWGRDDPDRDAMDRLHSTVKGASKDDDAPRAEPSYLGSLPTSSATYFSRDLRVKEKDVEPTVKPWRSTASEVVAASGTRLLCETPADGGSSSLPTSVSAPESERVRGSDRAASGSRAKQPSKRRMKPRRDRQIIFYLATADDTAEGIARRFQVEEDELRNINRMGRSEKLSEGTLVRIPVPRGKLDRFAAGEKKPR